MKRPLGRVVLAEYSGVFVHPVRSFRTPRVGGRVAADVDEVRPLDSPPLLPSSMG